MDAGRFGIASHAGSKRYHVYADYATNYRVAYEVLDNGVKEFRRTWSLFVRDHFLPNKKAWKARRWFYGDQEW